MKPYALDRCDGDKHARKSHKIQARTDVIRRKKKQVRQQSQLLVKEIMSP